jgi:hypothetical protein
MPSRDEISDILASFMNTATPAEIQELKTILASRKQTPGLRNMDVPALAARIAESIKQQLGVSEEMVRESATAAARRLIRAYVPGIGDTDLDLLLQEMIPSLKKNRAPRLPPEALNSMIERFVRYASGNMKEAEQAELGEGFAGKYWSAFPTVIQGLISKLLHKEIDSELFRLAVDEAVKRMGKPTG